MAFSTYINLIVGGDQLSAYSTSLPAGSSINAGSPVMTMSGTATPTSCIEALTCFVTGVTFQQTTFNGGVIYSSGNGYGGGVFHYSDTNSYPFKLSTLPGSTTPNTMPYAVTATGLACASGIQVASLIVSLSSTALSGTSAATVIPVTVLNPNGNIAVNIPLTQLNGTSFVYCQNTVSSNGNFVCQDDQGRMIQQILG